METHSDPHLQLYQNGREYDLVVSFHDGKTKSIKTLGVEQSEMENPEACASIDQA